MHGLTLLSAYMHHTIRKYVVCDHADGNIPSPDSGHTRAEWNQLLAAGGFDCLPSLRTPMSTRLSAAVAPPPLSAPARIRLNADAASPRPAISVDPVTTALAKANAETDPMRRAVAFANASELIAVNGRN